MAIINIRGTSGSGKSTLMRRIMELYPNKMSIRLKDVKRKQPIGYLLTRPTGRPLAVIGHYETACGGCDTIPDYEMLFGQVRTASMNGMDVVFEGLLISGDVNHTASLLEMPDHLTVIGLELPLQECIDSVNQRRWAKNPDKPPVKEANTKAKWHGTKLAMKRLEERGVKTEWHDRDGAYHRIRELLSV